VTATVRCPFCGAEQQATLPVERGSFRLQCDRCHRTCLVEVRVTLGLFRSVTARIL
jgi:transcription elongation factor Elf1